jgi:transcriptional regulator with XRE-family HTH domain
MDTSTVRPVGDLLREWRQRRRLSQLDLACEAEISTRHLSFLETGRSLPSRQMILRLADRLDIPLRERNALLIGGGYAPVFPERPLGDPALHAARAAIDLVLTGHEPCPALAIDRHWTLIAANRAVAPLIASADPALLGPPVNVLRLSLHPQGLAPLIINYTEWRHHLLARLRRQIDVTADPVLTALLGELTGYPRPPAAAAARRPAPERDFGGIAVPLELKTAQGKLAFFSTTTVFGTPVDITLSELAIEAFFPADAATAEVLRTIAQQQPASAAPEHRALTG